MNKTVQPRIGVQRQTVFMDISVLQTFVEVVRQGSFAAVARDRNIDPSSISRAIASLEKELGIRLFQRTTRKLSPTEAGQLYFNRIEPLVEEMQQAVAMATDVSHQPKGALRVTASVSFGLQCIVPLLPGLEAQYPHLHVELLLTDAVVDLLSDRIDLAIRLGPLADSTLMAQRLLRTRYAVCASPDYLSRHGSPQTPEAVSAHNCLRFSLAGYRSRWRFRDASGAVSEVPVQGRTIISNAMGLRDCAIAGMGLALLPHWLIDDELAAGQLQRVLPDYAVTATHFETAAWLIYPSRRYVPMKVRAFIDYLKQHLS